MTVTRPCYCTRAQVKRAADIKLTAHNNWQIDIAMAAAADSIEGLTHRQFYPQIGTKYFDWPNFQGTYPWKVYLDAAELADIANPVPTVTTGGNNPQTITPADVIFGPWNYCLAPGTRVLCTDLVWRNIEDLAVGDTVIGFDEELKTGVKGTPATTLRESVVESTGLKELPCARVVLENGREIIASYNHMWVSSRGSGSTRKWRKTYDPSKYRESCGEDGLQAGDYLSLYAEPWEVQDSYGAGYLAGFMDGEANLDLTGHAAMFSFAQNPGATLERVRAELKRFGFEISDRTYGTKCLKFKLNGERAALRFLGMFQPERFRARARKVWEGVRPRCRPVRVVSVEPIGNRTVVAIGTSTRTLIAEGFLSHNSPPYTRIELDRSTSAALGVGNTPQRDTRITGVFGYWIKTTPGGTLAANLTDTTGTAVQVSNGAAVDAGDNILIDSERMLVTDRAVVTTGQAQQGSGVSTKSNADNILAVADGSKFSPQEEVLLDAERMLITDVAGNNLAVIRAWNGTALATHTGATVYADRLLTVQRGALGTTAATHTAGAAVNVAVVPGLVNQLAIAESLVDVAQQMGAYTTVQGEGATGVTKIGQGLPDLRQRVFVQFARQARQRVV